MHAVAGGDAAASNPPHDPFPPAIHLTNLGPDGTRTEASSCQTTGTHQWSMDAGAESAGGEVRLASAGPR